MSKTKTADYLRDTVVLELGSRISASVCGSLFAEAGATVFFIEPAGPALSGEHKWSARDLYSAGKHSLQVDSSAAADDDLLVSLARIADVVLLSSDIDAAYPTIVAEAWREDAIVCDFTAFGASGPRSGEEFDDAMIQALSGVAHTTGFADGPPAALRVPVMEYSTGVYGAAGTVAALIARDGSTETQVIDMALYDCAVNSLATFLPEHFGGGIPKRLGNGHMMCAPWNAYKATDGWVLICSASDPSWRRLCEAIGKPQLADDERYATLKARLAHRDGVDGIVQSWVGGCSVAGCVETLLEVNVACGPIVSLADAASDRNLRHRSMVREIEGASSETVCIPGALLKAKTGDGRVAAQASCPDGGRAIAQKLLTRKSNGHRDVEPGDASLERPLRGICVLEIGQYTTAPLACRHLAALGAKVIKIEPPEGDAARNWPPYNIDESYFFKMSNAGKQSISIDLKSEEGRRQFTILLKSADMFVENLKPGSMARLGFDAKRLEEINPKLIYCAISGFGADAVYHQRPAFDTVLQAMSGMMDANASNGVPLKSGVSVCDFMGGEVGLFFLLAAVRNRQRTQLGDIIDLSMQDVATWMTAPLWGAEQTEKSRMVECSDGYVLVDLHPQGRSGGNHGASRGQIQSGEDRLARLTLDCRTKTRAQAVNDFAQDGFRSVPVQEIAEMVDDPQTMARNLLFWKEDARKIRWPLLGSPLKMSRTQPQADSIIGKPEPASRVVEHLIYQANLV